MLTRYSEDRKHKKLSKNAVLQLVDVFLTGVWAGSSESDVCVY